MKLRQVDCDGIWTVILEVYINILQSLIFNAAIGMIEVLNPVFHPIFNTHKKKNQTPFWVEMTRTNCSALILHYVIKKLECCICCIVMHWNDCQSYCLSLWTAQPWVKLHLFYLGFGSELTLLLNQVKYLNHSQCFSFSLCSFLFSQTKIRKKQTFLLFTWSKHLSYSTLTLEYLRTLYNFEDLKLKINK